MGVGVIGGRVANNVQDEGRNIRRQHLQDMVVPRLQRRNASQRELCFGLQKPNVGLMAPEFG